MLKKIMLAFICLSLSCLSASEPEQENHSMMSTDRYQIQIVNVDSYHRVFLLDTETETLWMCQYNYYKDSFGPWMQLPPFPR
ncbi:MAG: hypothetical protein K2X50_09775 [Gammaproteobacteria bacterium]|nr:hypothetical protein [Gammaproteobacteria bacterium]